MYTLGILAKEIALTLEIGKKTVYRVLKKYDIPLQSTYKNNCLICSKECDKKICGTCNTNLRRYRVKKEAVKYLGSKCEKCNWVGNLSGYDFHHEDPNEKEFSPNALNLANKSWDVVKQELDKCQLLCAICHRLEHNNYDLLEEISLIYTGKTFK